VIAYPQHTNARLQQALIIGASLALVLSLAAFALLAFAIQQRVLQPPAFSVRIGHVQFGAPCPTPAFDCDTSLNYYAIWRGQDLPDGSVQFYEIFFTYLPKKQR
jgi:hypothetical protein